MGHHQVAMALYASGQVLLLAVKASASGSQSPPATPVGIPCRP